MVLTGLKADVMVKRKALACVRNQIHAKAASHPMEEHAVPTG
jgi:hypothetical protein